MNAPLTPDKIMQGGLGFWASKTLLSAVELGLFTELAKGPLPAEAVGERLGLHPRARRDFLDALVSLGLLMSLNMLIETPGGFDYTGADCTQWMREAGFRQTRVEHLAGPDAM
jgi:hypothetical protein